MVTGVAGRAAGRKLGLGARGRGTDKPVNDFFEDLEENAEEGEPADSKLEAKPEAAASLE